MLNENFEIKILENEEFGDEYDELFNEVSKAYKIIGDRGADYLNWRYLRNPLYKTDRVVISERGKLKGYIIFYINDGIAVFKDML